MANISDNLFVRGARGNVKKQIVYRRRGENTHIMAMPVFDPDRPPSPAQKKMRNRFGDASCYAKAAIEDPYLKAIYQNKAASNQTAFNIALRDFSRPPVVTEIDHRNYTGAVGSSIAIYAEDDVRVVKVVVRIINAAGDVLEEGDAVLNPRNLVDWRYTAVGDNTNLTGSVIVATAFDFPDHTGSMEVWL